MNDKLNPVFNWKDRIILYNNNFLTADLSSLTNSIDLIVTSPPYNVGIEYDSINDTHEYEKYMNEFTYNWLSRVYELLKDDGRICVNIPLDSNKNGNVPFLVDFVNVARKIGFQYKSTIIWNKNNISKRTAWGSWLSASAPSIIAQVEVIVMMYKKSWKKLTNSKSTITREEFIEWTDGTWNFPPEKKSKIGHPAPFPIDLPLRCIKLLTYETDTVVEQH